MGVKTCECKIARFNHCCVCFQAVIKDVLDPYETALRDAGTNSEDLAEYIRRSARAAKDFAKDKQQLMQHLRMIVLLSERAAGLR